ncbi:MAG TPA: Abi-alpha family protein [Solirubrobacteraceae bacterium]|nr:Abi-alpha family protein [Solirubrobacteraceae bacterium]
MIGSFAGLADKSRVPAYMNNLNRLGLIWISREMLTGEAAYHLLEAQPEVLEAFKGEKIDIVMRSIELTAFGKNLCAQCGLMAAAEINARASLGEVTRALPPPDAR